jgi:signal transduction histidine kinase
MQFPDRLPRRQALLFLAAILVPCAVLLLLGLRLLEQDRQLEARKLVDERRDLIQRASQQLLSDLEKIKLLQMTRAAANSGGASLNATGEDVMFVGRVGDGQLLLPWEDSLASRRFVAAIRDGEFAVKLQDAERREVIAKQYETAADQYRAALAAATQDVQRSYARLFLARTLERLERRQESLAEWKLLAAAPSDLVDEYGVPLGLYATPKLVEAGTGRELLLEWVRMSSEQGNTWPTVALGMARDLAIRSNLPNFATRLSDLIRIHEVAEALQRDWPRLMPAFRSDMPVWISYGEPPWLASLSPAVGGTDRLVVAVLATDAIKRTSPPLTLDPSGQFLGESFPGLRVAAPEAVVPQGGSRQSFLITALILVLVFTLLTGYLLWRDVRRDLRLAEMRSQFVSSVSHELKTPLAAIRMFTETLRLDEEVDRGTRNEYLDTILHESERLSRLVDNVLDFGKIERGKKTYRFQPVRLQDVVEQAARAAQYPFEQAGFSLKVSADTDLPPVGADSDALQQAILNLLTNAMKYSGDSRQVGLSLARQNGHAHIRVEDHGVGIAPEEQKRIFDRFYRVPSTENSHIPGTGLGLTIVDHIAKAHGGAVEVMSRPGEGSSFTISLPVGDPS